MVEVPQESPGEETQVGDGRNDAFAPSKQGQSLNDTGATFRVGRPSGADEGLLAA